MRSDLSWMVLMALLLGSLNGVAWASAVPQPGRCDSVIIQCLSMDRAERVP